MKTNKIVLWSIFKYAQKEKLFFWVEQKVQEHWKKDDDDDEKIFPVENEIKEKEEYQKKIVSTETELSLIICA